LDKEPFGLVVSQFELATLPGLLNGLEAGPTGGPRWGLVGLGVLCGEFIRVRDLKRVLTVDAVFPEDRVADLSFALLVSRLRDTCDEAAFFVPV